MANINDIPGLNMLWSLLNPQRGYEEAGKEVTRGWNEAKNYLDPYQKSGLDQLLRLQGGEDALLHPDTLINQWMKGYEVSPYAKQLQGEATDQGLNAASSMGLMGSSAALKNLQTSASNIMRSDRSNYLQDLMDKYRTGLSLGQNIYNTGAQAGNALAQGALSTGENMGSMKFGENNAPGELLPRIAAILQQIREMGESPYGT